MLVVTNRNLLDNQGHFGDEYNVSGPRYCHVAKTYDTNKGLEVKVLSPREEEGAFAELVEKMHRTGRNCLTYVHGYNTSFERALDNAKKLQDLYQVEVILFSWPAANKADNYFRDRNRVENSNIAFRSTLHKIAEWTKKYRSRKRSLGFTPKFNLLCHSMGNYLFQYFAEQGDSERQTKIFHNISLISADCENLDHSWCEKVKEAAGGLFIVAINTFDYALSISQKVWDSKRLGNTLEGLRAKNVTYLDFSGVIGKEHTAFLHEKCPVKNTYFTLFNGGDPTLGLDREACGAYKILPDGSAETPIVESAASTCVLS